MNAIFTIVAKNYIGLAQVLEESIRMVSTVPFYIVVADEIDEELSAELTLPNNVLIAKNTLKSIDEKKWQEISFKYDLVEFCTSIKPACFDYFFNSKGCENVIYFDPDIFVLNALDSIFESLSKKEIILTPHILNPQIIFNGNYQDYQFLLNGTFNLGFIALKKTTHSQLFIKWWHNRLMNHCFFDKDNGTATDQKWINLLPTLFNDENYLISRHRGMNLAPWNFHERKIKLINEKFYVSDRDNEHTTNEPLLFAHFSGYDYTNIGDGISSHKTTNLNKAFTDLIPLFDAYSLALSKSNFKQYANLKYSYNFYNDGISVLSLHRRMYRRLIELDDFNYFFPFTVENKSYYSLLKNHGLLDKSTVLADKITNKTINNFSKKLHYVNLLFIFLKNIIGIRRYSILIRFLKRYCIDENQVFLITKKQIMKLK